MRPVVEDKARALLVAGAVTIEHVDELNVRATVAGYSGRYQVTRTLGAGWWCSCPARPSACSHVSAVRRVIEADR